MEPEKQITPILVINNASYKPYIEAFQYEPENIIQQPLGTLVGFFEVRDYNEDSAYIVNFLTSVLKKEYYINNKRAVTESLDAALHKVNLALSELAKNGNVNWMGSLDAAICVLEKNSIHFSVAGDARILLSRKETFTGISDGLASEESKIHPLKTFIQVASGRIEINDKIILCSHSVFSILTQEELRKNSNRLSEEKFVQFLKTALSNELDAAYAACILVKKTQPQIKKKPKKSERDISVKNAFSQQAFAKPPKEKTELIIPLLADSKTETEDNDGYTDKKTGHIYVQGEELPQDHNTGKWQTRLSSLKEGIIDSLQYISGKFRRKIFLLKKDFVSILEARAAKKATEKAMQASLAQKETSVAAKEIPQQVQSATTKPPASIKKQETLSKEVLRTSASDSFSKNKTVEQFPLKETNKQDKQEILVHENPAKDYTIRKISTILKRLLGETRSIFKKSKNANNGISVATRPKIITPSLARIRKVFVILSRSQKTSAIAVVLLIIIIPLLFIKLSNRQKSNQQEIAVTEQPSGKQLLTGETNISLDAETKDIVSNAQTVSVISTKDESFAITEKSLISFGKSESKEYPFPHDFARPKASAYMADLDLIFLISEKDRLISFSPVNKQFKENTLPIPSGAKPHWIATYLTYLYLFDTEKNKIYRYPRVEGGFGEPVEWLKEELLLSDSNSVAIDENIYVASKENVLKLFKGKRESFSLQDTITTAQFDRIFTTLNSKYIYILDKKYSRLIKYDKSGTLIKQYYNESLADGTDISANSQDNSVFISTQKGIIELKVD